MIEFHKYCENRVCISQIAKQRNSKKICNNIIYINLLLIYFQLPGVQITPPSMATVIILDDDHPGIFHFENEEMTVTENIGDLLIKVYLSISGRLQDLA